MPTLWIEQVGQWKRRPLLPRLTVGRRPDCSVVIRDSRVPPVALIFQCGGDSGPDVLKSVGQRDLILINGRAAPEVHAWQVGDEIAIAGCRILITGDDQLLPPESAPLAQVSEPRTRKKTVPATRVRVACGCGHTFGAVASSEVGRQACPRCGEAVRVPSAARNRASHRNPDTPRRVAPYEQAGATSISNAAVCSICQTTIAADEEQTTCPGCQLPHHADCWQENLGCSAYGCSHVNRLRPGPDFQVTLPDDPARLPGAMGILATESHLNSSGPEEMPWDYLLLACSLICGVVGLLTWGLPCIASDLLAITLSRQRPELAQTATFRAVRCLDVLGFLVGIFVSGQLYQISTRSLP